ncbi:MAG TPA: M50 family metallopeptidase [Thermoanaerobaculia bacterium]|nr:M50 family metallopeptidase [Thermoanaerobaculia bacterium]
MIHLGSIGGTSIDIDLSFLFLVAFFVIRQLDPQTPVAYALMWVPILFVSVLIHELAHAGAFALFGYGSSRVVLNGWGGVTYNGSREIRPWQDMIISVAGPFASFGLAVLMWWLQRHVAATHTDPMLSAMVPALFAANVFWGLFNLLPIPPLDGGHAVRGLLRSILSERLAFIIAVWIAMVVGVAVVAYTLWQRDLLFAFLLGFFVWRCVKQWQEFRNRGIIGD